MGLEALTFYRKSFNERLQEFTDKPLHDWSSHGADAFRGLAVRPVRYKTRARKKPPTRSELFAGRGGTRRTGGSLSWMH